MTSSSAALEIPLGQCQNWGESGSGLVRLGQLGAARSVAGQNLSDVAGPRQHQLTVGRGQVGKAGSERLGLVFMGFDDELADRQRRTVSGKQFLECYSSDQPTRAVAEHNFVAACARVELNDLDELAVVGQLGADGETDSLGGHDDASMTCCGVNNVSRSTRYTWRHSR